MAELENKVSAAIRLVNKHTPYTLKDRELDMDAFLNDPQKSLTLLGLVEGALCQSSLRQEQAHHGDRHFSHRDSGPLPVRFILVLRHYCGLFDGNKHTLKETGEYAGPFSGKESLSQEQVRNMVGRATRAVQGFWREGMLPELDSFFRENSVPVIEP